MKAKIQQFLDYYVMYVVVAVVLLGTVGYFVKSVILDRKEVALSVMVINDSMELDIARLEVDLGEVLGIQPDKKEISVTVLNNESPEDTAVIMTRLRARAVDLIIADPETFTAYAENSIYADLTDTLSGNSREHLEIDFVKEKENLYDDTGEVTGQGAEKPYGLDISSGGYGDYNSMLSEPVAGITINAEHTKAAAEALEWLHRS